MEGKKSSQIVDQLNQALKLEYSIIIYIPRIASIIEDEKTREMALTLGNAAIKHADTVANAISVLGGNPEWAFESVPVGKGLVEIFKEQLDREKLALQLHQESAGLIQDRSLKLKFEKLARDHERHIQLINDILLRLEQR